jgi:hypothetical protein
LRNEKHADEHSESDEDSTEETSVIVQLTNRVQDGTRCRPGSLDMCIQGKCQVKYDLFGRALIIGLVSLGEKHEKRAKIKLN